MVAATVPALVPETASTAPPIPNRSATHSTGRKQRYNGSSEAILRSPKTIQVAAVLAATWTGTSRNRVKKR